MVELGNVRFKLMQEAAPAAPSCSPPPPLPLLSRLLSMYLINLPLLSSLSVMPEILLFMNF